MRFNYRRLCPALDKLVPFYLVNLTRKFEWLGPITEDLTLRCNNVCPHHGSCPNEIYHVRKKTY